LLILLPPPASWSQSAPPSQVMAQNDQESLERWQRMTPQEKQELRDRFQRWRSLPPQEQQELKQKFETWRNMDPQKKAEIRKNFDRWRELPPQQQERLRERWQQWRALPPERREALKRRFEQFRELPPEKRRELREKFQEKFQGLSPEEKQELRQKFRERLERLSPEPKPASQVRFPNHTVTVEKVLKKLPQGSKIALEATGSWWWFVDLAQRTGHEVVMWHPKQTKAIASARLKSDKVDALMLAKLLKADLLPTVWIPPAAQRYVRELLTHRARLVRQRTSVI